MRGWQHRHTNITVTKLHPILPWLKEFTGSLTIYCGLRYCFPGIAVTACWRPIDKRRTKEKFMQTSSFFLVIWFGFPRVGPMCRFLPVLPTLSIRREWLLRSRRSYSFDRHLSSLFNSFLASFHSTRFFSSNISHFSLRLFPYLSHPLCLFFPNETSIFCLALCAILEKNIRTSAC